MMQDPKVALVIDKNVVDRRSVVSLLRNEFQLKNPNIHQCAAARDAVAVLQNEGRVDWIIMDIDLPDGSGFDFLERARDIASAKNSSVILMSTRRDKEALLMAAAAGVDDYVLKPFNTGTMATKIRKVANGHEKRESERVEDHSDHEVVLQFEGATYTTYLLDVSLGGCQVRSEVFRQGGCIYDTASLTIKAENGDIAVQGMLVRTEVDHDSDNKGIRAGFRFQNLKPETLNRVSEFIGQVKGKNQTVKAAS